MRLEREPGASPESPEPESRAAEEAARSGSDGLRVPPVRDALINAAERVP